MTFRQKYTKLQNEKFVAKMIVNSSYATMALEGQAIEKSKVKVLYDIVQKNKKKST